MQSSDYYGNNHSWFVGVVEQLFDEAYVRVRVYGIHPIDKTKVPTEHLPLMLVTYPTTGGQAGSGSLTHNLQVDSWVTGFWADYPICQVGIITAVIGGGSLSGSTYNSQGGEFVGQGNGGGSAGDSGDVSGIDTSATTNIPGGSNGEKVYNFLSSKLQAEGYQGDIHLHVAAAMGCMQVESPGFRPEVEGGFKGRAWGICQWLDPRRRQLFGRYGPTKRLDHQLDFMWWEMNNTEKRAKRNWLNTSNLPDATAGFATFERADDVNQKTGVTIRSSSIFKKRLQFAYKFYNSMKQTGSISSSGPAIDTKMTPGGSV